jgi:hypothetical protein
MHDKKKTSRSESGAPYTPDDDLVALIKKNSHDNSIPCSKAIKISDETEHNSIDVGKTLNFCGINIIKCQLGLFGYTPQKRIVKKLDSIDPGLEKAIKNHLVNNRLPCIDAWKIADEFGRTRLEIGSAAETMNIKISQCQLGAF